MQYAVVFPGQGSQSVNMLAELVEAHPVVGNTFAEASDVLGYDLAALIRDNPGDKLNQTEYTQPAMLAAGVAVWRLWEQRRPVTPPALLAGHSLGEYSALVAGGALAFSDAVGLVAERGRLMQAAVPEGRGGMAAVLGLDDRQVIDICEQAGGDQVVEAVNFNSPGQVVIAGHREAVDRAIKKATEVGAKRAMLLPVSVPSHSSLMRPAADHLYERIQQVQITAPLIPVLHNADAAAHPDPADIGKALKQQLHSPVRWVDTVNAMIGQGIGVVLEFGPGKVLAGLCRRIDKRMTVAAVDSPAGLQKALEIAGE